MQVFDVSCLVAHEWRIQTILLGGELLSLLDRPLTAQGQPRRQLQPTGGAPAFPPFFSSLLPPPFPFLFISHSVHFSLKNITANGKKLNDFAENQSTKFHAVFHPAGCFM